MNRLPKETFVFDELKHEVLEQTLDRIELYNDLEIGIQKDVFVYSQELKPFVPVATYDFGDDFDNNDEYVSMIEGTVMPFFGFAYRLDKC